MIAALCRTTAALAPPDLPAKGEEWDEAPTQVSGRKKSALFSLAERFVLAAEKSLAEGADAWSIASTMESRKSLKIVFNALASGAHSETIRPALVSAGFADSDDPGDRLEADMLAAGAIQALHGEHPYVIMRAMTARLGFEYYDTATEWILERTRKHRPAETEFIVPGDLPEIISRLDAFPGRLELTLRMAGREMSAAALCGCPSESVASALACFGRIGGVVLEDSIRSYQSRLSTEEMADAQAAFADLAREFDESKPGNEPDRPANAPEPGLADDLTNLILELDPRLLKTVALSMDPKKLASLLQAMSPVGHDRILATIGPMRESRVINALDDALPLESLELTREAQAFAQKILAFAAPKGSSRSRTIPLPVKVRNLLSSILGRE